MSSIIRFNRGDQMRLKMWRRFLDRRTENQLLARQTVIPDFLRALPAAKISVGAAPHLRMIEMVRSVRENVSDPGAGGKIPRAFSLVREGHAGQLRRSGEKYEEHPFAVAEIVAGWGLGEAAVVAALGHDLIEDAVVRGKKVDKGDLLGLFGREVADLVDGVTELGKEPGFAGQRAKPSFAEIYDKLIRFGARDLRTIMIKLADRLHNLRTLEYLEAEKRRAKAYETLYVFGKAADILGMWDLKRELQDLCFEHLLPEDGFEYSYGQMQKKRGELIAESRDKISGILKSIDGVLLPSGMRIEIDIEIRAVYEFYERMQRRKITIQDLTPTDVWRFCVTVPDLLDCYNVMGRIHAQLYRPVYEELHDFIGAPPANGHQFLHTYVEVPGFGRLLIQIRDRQMNASYHQGILTKIKSDPQWYKRDTAWLNALREYLRGDIPSEGELFDLIEAVSSPVSVFDREGRRVELPYGATLLDFAAAVNSRLFEKASGALVNNRPAPLSQVLKEGDVIEVLTDKNARPELKWRDSLKTPRAVQCLQDYLKRRNSADLYTAAIEYLNEKSIEMFLPARELMQTEFMRNLLIGMGYKDEKDFLDQLSLGRADIGKIISEAQKIYFAALADPEVKGRDFGVLIIGKDREGLLNDITSKLRKIGLNLVSGDFFNQTRERKNIGVLRLVIAGVRGPIGEIQKLQVYTVVEKTEGVVHVEIRDPKELGKQIIDIKKKKK